MANCGYCNQEMLRAITCMEESVVIAGRSYRRIPFGEERPRWSGDKCGDCGVRRGGFHHPGCDIERCPACKGQAITCGCLDEPDEDTEPPYVDVPHVIRLMSDLTLEDPEPDLISMDPVAPCGHVGRGHMREMVRDGEPPLEQWFWLGSKLYPDTRAVIFTCRTEDLEHVSERDLDVARRIDAYARTNGALPWDLAYITKHGHYMASDLLSLSGLPDFDPCPYDD